MPRRFRRVLAAASAAFAVAIASPGNAGELSYTDVNPFDSRMLIYAGKPEEAVKEAKTVIAALRPTDDLRVVRRIGEALTYLCEAHAELGQYGQAEAACLEAVATFEEVAKVDPIGEVYKFSLALPQLATTYETMRRYGEALEIRMRQLRRSIESIDYVWRRASLRARIGDLHLALGNRPDAQAAYLEAIAEIKNLDSKFVRDRFHVHPLLAYRSLAQFYWLEERFDEAETVLDVALAELEANFGADDQYTVLLSEAQGRTYFHQGRYAEARAIARDALDFYDREGDADTLLASNAKILLARIEDAETPGSPEAARLLTNALQIPEDDSGLHYLANAVVRSQLAHHHLLTGNFAEAESFAREASEALGWLFSEIHSETARAKVFLARALQGLGKRAEALSFAQSAYAAQWAFLPAYHRETGETLILLAELYDAQGQRENLVATRTLLDAYRDERAKFESEN